MVRFKHRYILTSILFVDSALDHLPILHPAASSSSSSSNQKKGKDESTNSSSHPSVTESAIIHLLRDALRINFGDLAAGEIGGTFSVKYLSPTTHTMILRVSREHFQTLWCCLTLLRKLGGKPVIIKVEHVSGTIRKVQHAAMRLDRTQILRSHRRGLEKQRRRRKGTKELGEIQKGEEEEEETRIEGLLKDSEEKILAMEA